MKVVFVHLGPAKASHLKRNISHVARNFPYLEITLITSPEAHSSLGNIKDINHYKYRTIEEVSNVISSLEHNPKFRKGFWFYSLERIFALRDWSKQFPDQPFLHIESDILIMRDFPFNRILELDRLAWTRHSDGADVATFMYSPNSQEIEWVAEQVTQIVKIDANATDMSALASISKNNPNRVLVLPSTVASELNVQKDKDLIDYFGGIFDPAAYGMWLTGQDPRNNLGLIRKFLAPPGAEVNPAEYRYKSQPLGTLKILDNNKEISLFNLHLHNKRLSLFGRFWKFYLALDVAYSRKRLFKSLLSPRAVWAILSDFHYRHGLFTFKAFEVLFRQLRAMRSK